MKIVVELVGNKFLFAQIDSLMVERIHGHRNDHIADDYPEIYVDSK